MPLIVVGADTKPGEEILSRLEGRKREIRVFVSDESRGLELRAQGFKVATGDVSDESHVEAAAFRCFSAVLVAEAAMDHRERSFADTPEQVMRGWANAVENSRVTRVIWVSSGGHPEVDARDVVVVSPQDPDFAGTVIDLDEAHSIS